MNVVQPNHCQPSINDLESPSVEMVEKLRSIMQEVYIPAGLRSFNPEECDAIKEFACQLPISRGFNPGTLHLLHRLVARQFVGGAARTTVDWPMLVQAWTDLCTLRNHSHLVAALPVLMEWCFEPSCIRVIGLMELTWDADSRQITIRANQPNFNRMADYLKSTFNIETGETLQPPATNAV